jgi:hypothetical protein
MKIESGSRNGPASIKQTEMSGSSDNLAASTQPAVPPPLAERKVSPEGSQKGAGALHNNEIKLLVCVYGHGMTGGKGKKRGETIARHPGFELGTPELPKLPKV